MDFKHYLIVAWNVCCIYYTHAKHPKITLTQSTQRIIFHIVGKQTVTQPRKPAYKLWVSFAMIFFFKFLWFGYYKFKKVKY